MNNVVRAAAAITLAANISACATITRGTKQKFEITSEPSEAHVTTTLGDKCVTPCKLKLKRKEAFTATFTREGYETQQVNVRSKFSGGGAAAGAGNVLLGGFIGAGVDASSGALNNLEPNPLKVVLKPLVSPALETVATAAPVAPTGNDSTLQDANTPLAPVSNATAITSGAQ